MGPGAPVRERPLIRSAGTGLRDDSLQRRLQRSAAQDSGKRIRADSAAAISASSSCCPAAAAASRTSSSSGAF
jgi:hypothetical protein